MRIGLVGLALGAMLLGLPTQGWSAQDPSFVEGTKLLKQLEYVRAIQAFEKALAAPGSTAAQRAESHLQIGIARSGLTEYDAAEASFKRALTEDRTVTLPPHTSPKIKALFEKVRAELPPPTTPAPTTAAPVLPPSTSPIADESDTEEDLTKGPRRSSTNWPAWIALGAGVAAGGVGLAMGLMNRSEKSKAEDSSLYYSEAQDHADSAASYGLAANVLFGLAGAAVVTSGVLFYLGHRKQKQDTDTDMSAAVVPTPSGVVLQLGFRR